MADNTPIEWTDATWNPVVGCSVISPGCTNCYAMRQAPRTDDLSIGAPWAGPTGKLTKSSNAGPVWTGTVRLVERRLDQPLRWRRPRKIFVNSMGDLFHENVPDEWIDRVFAVMALCPQHTFQVLTKRAARMRAYLTGGPENRIDKHMNTIAPVHWCARELENDLPLPNVWLGISAEDQARADERIPDLLATPAAVRFLSCEPLIGPIDLRNLVIPRRYGSGLLDAFTLDFKTHHQEVIAGPPKGHGPVDWVIAGGESGPGARPMHPDWARSLRDQCAAAAVPFFFKQWGTWIDADERASHGFYPPGTGDGGLLIFDEAAAIARDQGLAHEHLSDGRSVFRIAKSHRAQRLLGGVKHEAFPA